jgi:hypothetical protein
MNRRMFLQMSGTTAVAVMVLPMTGCSLKGDAQNVIDVLNSVVNADPNGAWVPDLKIAIADAQTAIANWNGSSTNCELQSAITIASAILDSLPLGLTIDLIVTVAVAGIDALLADLLPCTTTVLQSKLSHVYTGSYHRHTGTYTQYYAKFHSEQKWALAGDFKRAYNSAALTSGLPQAQIK